MGTTAMPVAPLSRRSLILAAALAPLQAWAASARVAPPVVTVLGDSITAGLGLPMAQALPAQLQQALMQLGVRAQVRGAGVSGDTSAGGLARADFSVQSDTAVCVIELGANDYLQSVDPAETERNLAALIVKLQRRGIKVVLAGGELPARASGAYGRQFAALYPRLAHRLHVALAPDLLAGVEDNPAMKQADGLHPNARGVQLICARLAPVVAQALRRS